MSAAEVVVEGARFVFDDDGSIAGSSRIPSERVVVRLTFPGAPRPGWRAEGRARLVGDGLVADVRDDAVLILRAVRPVCVGVETRFRPVYDESARGRRLALDEDGGFGVFPTRPGAARDGVCDLRPRDELWISVCPPRRPSALRLAQEIAHEGRPRPFPDGAYPTTAIVADAARHCQVLALHAYFWKSGPRRVDLRAGRYALRRRPWTTPRHVPADPERFARVQDDVRRAGMKLVVYLSPRHSTTPDLLAEMRRILDEHGVDGFYLDGVSDDFRASDAVVRGAREVLGPDRVLYLNASDEPLGTPRVRCPFIDARADFVLRGDAGRGGLPLDRFLRYAVSGRNISNSVGVWCHYGSSGRVLPVDRAPSAAHIAAALRNDVRLWRRSAWGAGLAAFDREYYGARRGGRRTP